MTAEAYVWKSSQKRKSPALHTRSPAPRKPGRGRPPEKGAAVHLKELSLSHEGQFQETQMELYGKKERIRYYCTDLLWGQKLYQELRFVLVEMDGIQSILASTSLALDPLSIIRLYSYRFRIEYTFRELKQQIGAFCFHFWSKYMHLFHLNAACGACFGGWRFSPGKQICMLYSCDSALEPEIFSLDS